MFSIIKGLTLSQDELDQYYIQKRKRYYERHGAGPKFIKLHFGFKLMEKGFIPNTNVAHYAMRREPNNQ